MGSVVDLQRACFGDVKNLKYQMAILPWGSTEPHNYHLPYMTDAILAHDISVDAAVSAKENGVLSMILPPVFLGAQNPGQRELPFCIHGRYETQKAILIDVIDSLRYQGISKLLIVSGHGGNSFKNMIRDILVDYPDFFIASCEWFNLSDGKDIFSHDGEHAHELETSVMMHYHPELVDLSLAGSGNSKAPILKSLAGGLIWMPRNWSEISNDTGIGNPKESSPEKGKMFSKKVVETLKCIIIDICSYKQSF